MANYSSHAIELEHVNPGIMRAAKQTLAIFRDAVAMIGSIAMQEWDALGLGGMSQQQRMTAMEHLIHATKNNEPRYPEFDERFYKFPTYYRRSAINFACGQVSSYLTRKAQYDKERYDAISNGRRFREKPPVLNLETGICPAMYQAYMLTIDLESVRLKLFIRNTWDWVEVDTPGRDMKNLLKSMAQGGKLESPTLSIKYHKLYLDFPIKWRHAPFPEQVLRNRKVLGVDLGVNHGAVCSVMDARGTIEARMFDPFASERDRMGHMLNRLRKIARQSGTGQSLAKFYTKLDGLKTNYARQLARWIVNQAREHGVYGIVMENLSGLRPRKRAKDRVHHWCKKKILSLVRGIARRYGIRVFLVNPRNTSALAFDGSGPVTRNKGNFSLCMFANGKRYHADLNASYNIAARYFIREYQKSTTETEWSGRTAKVPALSKRTDCTLATLRDLCALMAQEASAAA